MQSREVSEYGVYHIEQRLLLGASAQPIQEAGVLDATPTPTQTAVLRVADNPMPKESVDVWITIYLCPPYCGAMANGEIIYDGAVACGYGFDLGQRFVILADSTRRTYTCSDRGLGPLYWVDVFFVDVQAGWDWLVQVGNYGTVILR